MTTKEKNLARTKHSTGPTVMEGRRCVALEEDYEEQLLAEWEARREEWERHIDGDVCVWRENDDGAWEKSCGGIFEFTTGGPKENGFDFCPYCGLWISMERSKEMKTKMDVKAAKAAEKTAWAAESSTWKRYVRLLFMADNATEKREAAEAQLKQQAKGAKK